MKKVLSNRSAIGDHASGKQRVIDELVNPHKEENRNKAIAKSPALRPKDFCTDERLPKTIIQFKKGADKEKCMANFIERYQ